MTKAASLSLLDNSRFYILSFTLILSVFIIAWLRLQIPSDQLFYIRIQQIFGLFCIVYWYGALLISPIGFIVGKQRIKRLEFTRRAIGVSAFYFATLHGGIALWGQLGGLDQLKYLPTLFQWSLFGGAIAFGVLALLALTSFDRVVRYMTYRRWKLLHRLTYLGGILAILHVWSVGTHLAYTGMQLTAFVALVIIGALELYRSVKKINVKYLQLDRPEFWALFVGCWAIVSALIFMIPLVVENYHSRHEEHDSSSHVQERS